MPCGHILVMSAHAVGVTITDVIEKDALGWHGYDDLPWYTWILCGNLGVVNGLKVVGKKEVVLKHNKKICSVPGMTKEMMGRTADHLTCTLQRGVKSEFWSASSHFGIKVDRIQGILTDGAHWRDQYTSCGCCTFSPPCHIITHMWGEAWDWWRMLLGGREWRVQNKEFPQERLDGLDQGQTDEQACLN